MGRILVADDEVDFRKAVAEVLRDRGHDVWECGTVRAGLELLREREFQAVVSDLVMPGGTGFELLDQAHRLSPRAHLILLSCKNEPRGVPPLLIGAYEYVRKPVLIQDLIRLIEISPTAPELV
jgi:DNA-binding NtrC family response regulator